MEPTAKRISEAKKRGNNYYTVENNSGTLGNSFHFPNKIFPQKITERNYYRNNDSVRSGVNIGVGIDAGKGERDRDRDRDRDRERKRERKKVGNEIGIMKLTDEKKIRKNCQNRNLISNSKFCINSDMHIGMFPMTNMSTLNHPSVNMMPLQNLSMRYENNENEFGRIRDRNFLLCQEKVPIFYEPLKYPAFKMADKLKNEKTEKEKEKEKEKEAKGKEKERQETKQKQGEVIEEKKKGQEFEVNNDKTGEVLVKKEKNERIIEENEYTEKELVHFSENRETSKDEMNGNYTETKVNKIGQQKKEKSKHNIYVKELKYNEKLDETNDSMDLLTKQTACFNDEENTQCNKKNEEIKEFLTFSLNPQKITNEIKFILHMTLLTLYRDQIKPSYKKIKKRLKCFSENFEIQYNFLSIYALLQNQYIIVRSRNNVFVLLRETPKWFLGWVNTKSFINIYPKHVWKKFIMYLLDISRVKWEYTYSPFLLKFILYLKRNGLLFYVHSKDQSCVSVDKYGDNTNFQCFDFLKENIMSNENCKHTIYHYIEEKKTFSLFSYFDTYYHNKIKKYFYDSYISFLKEEHESDEMETTIINKFMDTTAENVSKEFQGDYNSQNNNCSRENQNIPKTEKENEKEKEKEETKATRICFEKYKTIFNSKENVGIDEKVTNKRHKWEFDGDIYEMASFLKKQNFSFFQNYSLGKIAHVVQLSLYNGLLFEEGQCIKPACTVKTIVPSVFYHKEQKNEGEEERKENVKEKDRFISCINTSSSVLNESVFRADEKNFDHNNSSLDENFSFGYSEYSKFRDITSNGDIAYLEKIDVFEEIINEIKEERMSYKLYNLAINENEKKEEKKKKKLFHWDYLHTKNDDTYKNEQPYHIKAKKPSSKNSECISESYNNLKRIEEEKWNNHSKEKQNDEIITTLKIIEDLEEAKTKVEQLLKSSYKKKIFLYLFREKFCRKYKEVINPIHFGYNSLIEFLFYACKEVCKIYILNKNIVLIHPGCDVSYLLNKKENILQPFSYLDYFYSTPEKKKQLKNKTDEKNEKFENHSLEICAIMKGLAKKRNNFLITFYFWKKLSTINKNNLNEFFYREEKNKQIYLCHAHENHQYYDLFESTHNDVLNFNRLFRKN